MTHHPVTKEELDMIKNDCAFPERTDCEECRFCNTHGDNPCLFKGANALMDEVLARPDPLEVLEKWRAQMKMNALMLYGDASFVGSLWASESKLIQEYRTNPDAIIERGKEEGWL